jgi:hypothetical protein
MSWVRRNLVTSLAAEPPALIWLSLVK